MSIKLCVHHATGQVYESLGWGNARLLTNEMLVPASIQSRGAEVLQAVPASPFPGDITCYFREDDFDPVTRLRRGRFYERGQVDQEQIRSADGGAIHGFTYSPIGMGALPSRIDGLVVFLGTRELNSPWSVVQIEQTHTYELQFTLRAKSLLGILPDITEAASQEMAKEHRSEFLRAHAALAEDLHRASPSAVVEMARNLASAIMLQQTAGENSPQPGELSKAADLFAARVLERKQNHLFNVVHCAKILANLHNKNKAATRLRSNYSELTEDDADLAVRCVAMMLRDLSWARQ